MSKPRERSELEALRAENKTLKKQVKHFKKEMTRKIKREHQYSDLEEREAELLIKEEMEERKSLKTNVCPKCSGKVEVSGGSKMKFYFCLDCGYRTSKKV